LSTLHSNSLKALDAFALRVDAHPLKDFLHGFDAVVAQNEMLSFGPQHFWSFIAQGIQLLDQT